MRSFETIEKDIERTERKLKQLKTEKREVPYGVTSNYRIDSAVPKGIRVFIWIPVSIIIPFALPLSIVAAIRYLTRNVRVATARRFTIFSGFVFFVFIADLLNNLIGKAPTLMTLLSPHFSDESLYIFFDVKYLNMSLENAFRLFGCGIDAFVLLPVTMMFVGSIVKSIREAKKKKACEQRVAELNTQIIDCENKLNRLNTELKDTKNKAMLLYYEEKAKENPERECMESLAALGYGLAQEWLDNTNHLRAKQIYQEYTEEIKKDQRDIKQIKEAADLGCPEACMYYAEYMLLGYSNDPFYENDDEDRGFSPSIEKKQLCLKLQPYFKTAAKSNYPNAKFYYLYTTERSGHSVYRDYCFSDQDLKALEKEFKKLIESKNIDEKYKDVCNQCLKHITQASVMRWQAKNRAELEKYSGFYSDLPSYQRMVNGSSGSTAKTVETVEYYPVVDVTGM